LGTKTLDASPTKDFFVRMITKDISLEDCILDLIDNCLDGARRVKHAANPTALVEDYSGFQARVAFDERQFSISDNCGGIKTAEAIEYAFHFGRRSDAPTDEDYSIGLYGIGMKRAIFKMGNLIEIYSSTASEAFRAHINVNEWRARTRVLVPGGKPVEDWDFDMDDAAVIPETGTRIDVTEIYKPIADQFANPAFGNALARIVARDYAQFISKGFEIFLKEKKIRGFPFTIRESDEFKPLRVRYDDESGVTVEIIAGMAGAPPDELQAEEGSRAETDYFGWYVLCNDRVIIAADKSSQTVWGDSGFPSWHYQYNGFIGMVSFHAKNPNLLPWKTTKRDVDSSNATYRRAVERMKEATRPWVRYTGERRVDIDEARRLEALATARPLFDTPISEKLVTPRAALTEGHVAVANILYKRPVSQIEKAKKLLGNSRMPNYRVGEQTFDYYLKSESEE
jgi:hypothetical protein